MFGLLRRRSTRRAISDPPASLEAYASSDYEFPAKLFNTVPVGPLLPHLHEQRARQEVQQHRGIQTAQRVMIKLRPDAVYVNSTPVSSTLLKYELERIVGAYSETRWLGASFVVLAAKCPHEGTSSPSIMRGEDNFQLVLFSAKQTGTIIAHIARLLALRGLDPLRTSGGRPASSVPRPGTVPARVRSHRGQRLLRRSRASSAYAGLEQQDEEQKQGPRRSKGKSNGKARTRSGLFRLGGTYAGVSFVNDDNNGNGSSSGKGKHSDENDYDWDDDGDVGYEVVNSIGAEGDASEQQRSDLVNSSDESGADGGDLPPIEPVNSSDESGADGGDLPPIEPVNSSDESDAENAPAGPTQWQQDSLEGAGRFTDAFASRPLGQGRRSGGDVSDDGGSTTSDSADAVSVISEMATEDEVEEDHRVQSHSSLTALFELDPEEDRDWTCVNCGAVNRGLYSDQCRQCHTLRCDEAPKTTHSTVAATETAATGSGRNGKRVPDLTIACSDESNHKSISTGAPASAESSTTLAAATPLTTPLATPTLSGPFAAPLASPGRRDMLVSRGSSFFVNGDIYATVVRPSAASSRPQSSAEYARDTNAATPPEAPSTVATAFDFSAALAPTGPALLEPPPLPPRPHSQARARVPSEDEHTGKEEEQIEEEKQKVEAAEKKQKAAGAEGSRWIDISNPTQKKKEKEKEQEEGEEEETAREVIRMTLPSPFAALAAETSTDAEVGEQAQRAAATEGEDEGREAKEKQEGYNEGQKDGTHSAVRDNAMVDDDASVHRQATLVAAESTWPLVSCEGGTRQQKKMATAKWSPPPSWAPTAPTGTAKTTALSAPGSKTSVESTLSVEQDARKSRLLARYGQSNPFLPLLLDVPEGAGHEQSRCGGSGGSSSLTGGRPDSVRGPGRKSALGAKRRGTHGEKWLPRSPSPSAIGMWPPPLEQVWRDMEATTQPPPPPPPALSRTKRSVSMRGGLPGCRLSCHNSRGHGSSSGSGTGGDAAFGVSPKHTRAFASTKSPPPCEKDSNKDSDKDSDKGAATVNPFSPTRGSGESGRPRSRPFEPRSASDGSTALAKGARAASQRRGDGDSTNPFFQR